MPASIRVGDMSVGHPDGPGPTPSIVGVPNHFVNGRPVAVVPDEWQHHGDHDVFGSQGSPNTFSGGLPRVRTGDELSCGDHAGEGSPDVFVN